MTFYTSTVSLSLEAFSGVSDAALWPHFPRYHMKLLCLKRSRARLAAVQHSDAPLSFPENCHPVATVRDVQFGYVSIYIIAGS